MVTKRDRGKRCLFRPYLFWVQNSKQVSYIILAWLFYMGAKQSLYFISIDFYPFFMIFNNDIECSSLIICFGPRESPKLIIGD